RHRADRRHPPSRHREEERDHDDRLRPRRRAPPGHGAARRHLSGLPAAAATDPDDDDGRAARRRAPRPRQRRGLGAAPAPRHHDDRRPDLQPGAHALYDPGHLSGVRPSLEAQGRRPRPGAGGGTRMSVSAPFIRRPAGTTLLTVAVALAGSIAYMVLPVSPLPQVEFPTISVSTSLPAASPETMAS